MASYIPPHKRRAAAAAAAAANKTTNTTAPSLSTTSSTSTSTSTTTQRWQPRHLQRSRGGGGGGGSSSSRFPRNEVRREFQRRQNDVRQAPRRTNSRWAAAAAPEPDSFGNFCQCASGQSSIYPCRQNTDHTVHHELESNPKEVLGKSLLGTHGQFCGGYYHTAASTEAGNPALCVGEGCIKAPTCVLVVRLEIDNSSDTLEVVFVSRYTNCYRGYEDSVHAEQFMMADPALLAILDAGECRGLCLFYGKRHSFLPLFFSLLHSSYKYAPFPLLLLYLFFSSVLFSSQLLLLLLTLTTTTKDERPKTLTMFITQQPCHHSSGRVETKHVSANTSCTNRILRWSQEYLQSRGVSVIIKLSRIFRAHWEDESVHETTEDAQVFGSRARMAKEGLMLLMREPNIRVTMIDSREDWMFLLSLSDSYVYHGGAKVGTEVVQLPRVTDGMITDRLDGDQWFNQFLIKLDASK